MKKKGLIKLLSVFLCVLLLSSCSGIHKENMALSNENADETTKAVFSFICDAYGEKIISGQQESIWVDGPEYEMNYLLDTTGKLPAMRGFDFMNDDFDGVTERASQWWEKGGLVTICWHCGADFTKEYNACKGDEITDWDAVLTDGTPENEAFIKNMDNAGNALLELQKRGVTVLWRPFHEFDGAWFWWERADPRTSKSSGL